MTKYMKKEELDKVKEETPVVLTHTALGTYKDEKTGRWIMAKITYNPATGDVGKLEPITNEEGSRDAIIHRFKIMCTKEGII